ncbi:MAG TPA: macro domain-containing protein [Thermomicrobiales bacterium]|jgi:O-acetyl-ADP-ribose deacetylase (regulator of RNase III)
MITYVLGNFFASPARTLVNTVNTSGVMGKGIAKVFRNAYPEMFAAYKTVCDRRSFGIGDLLLYPTPHKAILNFPTKTDWRRPSRVEYVEAGLGTFATSYAAYGLTSVAFPQLGCGNGGLDWERQVRPLMESVLSDLPIDIYIHVYDDQDHLPSGWDEAYLERWLQSPVVPMTGDEVWQELFRSAAARAQESEPGSSVLVLAWREQEAEALLIQSGQDALIWTRDDFAEWWSSSVGDRGIATMRHLEGVFDGYGEFIMTLLARLPEARRVRSAESCGIAAPIGWESGIQLLPRLAETPPTLVPVSGLESDAGAHLTQSHLPLSTPSHAA